MFSQLLVEASKERQNERVAMFTKTDSGGGDDSDILEKLSEYLFDLFDANLTKDFQKMEAFEQKACQIFDPNEEEYNFQQTEMHEQFKLLFEELTESFLTENGCNHEQLYEIAKDSIANKKTTSGESADKQDAFAEADDEELAFEIIEVIDSVLNFEQWATEMKDLRRRQLLASAEKCNPCKK
jgi:hypothetical protein|eukprot:g6308.t1